MRFVENQQLKPAHETADLCSSQLAHEPGVSDIRRHQNHTAAAQDSVSLVLRHTTVDVAERQTKRPEHRCPFLNLVLNECPRRIQCQYSGIRLPAEEVRSGSDEDQALPGSGGRRKTNVVAIEDGLDRLGLVTVQPGAVRGSQ